MSRLQSYEDQQPRHAVCAICMNGILHRLKSHVFRILCLCLCFATELSSRWLAEWSCVLLVGSSLLGNWQTGGWITWNARDLYDRPSPRTFALFCTCLVFSFFRFVLLVFWSDSDRQDTEFVLSRCKLQRKPFSFRTNAVLFLLVDKTIVWELSTREIGLSAAEKYSFAERRNTVWQRGDIQFSRAEKYRLLRGWSRWAGLLGWQSVWWAPTQGLQQVCTTVWLRNS